MTIERKCSVCELAHLEERPREFNGETVVFLHCPICDVRRCSNKACRAPQQRRLAICHRCGVDVE